MDQSARVAFINAQVACALAEIAGMQAANRERAMQGLSDAYDEKAFFNVQRNFMISHNAVIEFLRD